MSDAPQREVDRAREAALRLLDYRARSRRELAERLARKGFAPPVIAAATTQLESAGLVNDVEFARAWVHARMASNPRGAALIRWELRRKGVEESIIERTLTQEMGEERELEAALSVASRYAPRPGEDDSVRTRRLVGALRRRGFALDVIVAALARARGRAAV
jgi:regulatory protein